jgi:hypothetical protein
MPEDTIVTTEATGAPASEPKSFREHFEVAQAQQSTEDQAEPAPASDDTPESKPAQEPEEVADEPTDTTEKPEDAILSSEELATLPPKQRQNAEKWQAKLTQKAQALADQAREFGEWKPLIDSLKADPKTTVTRLVEQIGLKLAAQDTTPETKEVLSELPEEWRFLQPMFESLEKRVEARVRAELEPIKEAQNEIVTKASAAETESTIKAFDAKFPGWKKHESKMLEIGKKFVPTAGSMTDFQYMETLYKLATADIEKAEQVKETVKRINQSAAATESPAPGISDNRVEHALPPPDKRSIRDAYAAASQGIRWTD